MKVIFFGNRGSRSLGASEDSPFQKYGGDTTCVGVLCGDHLISLDTGSAFYKWRYTLEEILKRSGPFHMSVLYSHYHDDHTAGLPQSPLLFAPGNRIDFYGPDGAQSGQGENLSHVIKLLAGEPRNPRLFDAYKAALNVQDLPVDRGQTFYVGAHKDIKITTLPVKHGAITALGYRIDYQGKSFCFISDTHHELDAFGLAKTDPEVVRFLRGADVFCADSFYTDEEFFDNPKLSMAFGHSSAEHGMRLAKEAGVPLFIAHHYNPNKTDADIDQDMKLWEKFSCSTGVDIVAAKPSLCLDLTLSPEELRRSIAIQQSGAKPRYAAIAAAPGTVPVLA